MGGTDASKIRYYDGSEYIGQVMAGKEHGQGRIIYANGDDLVGNFENGQCV